jgi:hypothetical protein
MPSKSPTACKRFSFFLHNLERSKIVICHYDTKKACSYTRARAGRSGLPKKEIRCVRIPGTSRQSRQELTHSINSCQRCHSHKIKCSGDQPCSKCRAVGLADECAYATRDRQVKVSEKYASKPQIPLDQAFSKLVYHMCQIRS